jgi:hypothetical protein
MAGSIEVVVVAIVAIVVVAVVGIVVVMDGGAHGSELHH